MGSLPRQQPARGSVVLIHWHNDEWLSLAQSLRAMGWCVQSMSEATGLKLRDPESERPVAVVISQRRLPSHGREVAGAIWHEPWARDRIRIVFFDGKPEAVVTARSRFPGAIFTSFEHLPETLDRLAATRIG